jgi:hypothetical protein
MTYDYKSTANSVWVVIFAVLAGVGLVVMVMPGPLPTHGLGAFLLLFFLYYDYWLYSRVTYKSITVFGDRIEMVTGTGRKYAYNANQITKYWWQDPNTKYQRQMICACLYFEGGFSFMFEKIINDYAGLVEALAAIAPPDTYRRPDPP